jgi:hypothetical protein
MASQSQVQSFWLVVGDGTVVESSVSQTGGRACTVLYPQILPRLYSRRAWSEDKDSVVGVKLASSFVTYNHRDLTEASSSTIS